MACPCSLLKKSFEKWEGWWERTASIGQLRHDDMQK